MEKIFIVVKPMYVIIVTMLVCITLAYVIFVESYNTLDVTDFNKEIAQRTDIANAEQLVTMYYDYPPHEPKPRLSISTEKLENGRSEVTFIHDFMDDDSLKATKIIMVAEQKNGVWFVHSMKKNFQCYEGYGHTYWSKRGC